MTGVALATQFLNAASSNAVTHVVLLSARGVEFLPGGVVARAEEAVRQGPVAWTILRPSHFSQNFTEAMFTPVDGEILAPVGDGAEPFIDVQDIAEVAARVLVDDSHTGEVIALSGPEAITFARAAEILSDETGVPIHYVPEDREEHITRLRAAGTPELYITWRMAMLDGIRTGADAYVSSGVQEVLGRRATDFESWAHREAGSRVAVGRVRGCARSGPVTASDPACVQSTAVM